MEGSMQRHGPIDPQRARDVRAHLPAGVVVVTMRHGGELHGITVTAFSLAAVDPPRVLVCLETPSRSAVLIATSGMFAVNVVAWRQMFLADRFAGRGPLVDPRFSGVPYRLGATGAPLLAGALAWLECRVARTWPAGDHTVFLSDVVRAEAADGGEALVYFRRRYHRLRA
jgi:flavin reductase (DIM6/NTAB) family NADH-FMN oxidoreductase RutF